VRYIADEVLVMNKGRVVEMADSQSIYTAPREAYTRALLGSIPRGYVPAV
jgi:peptide/nickel transport system ATP-binding protein